MRRKHNHFVHPEAGGALIYILIAVVLFAVLAAAISRTNNGGISGPGQEVDRLQATEILQYARSLQTAVQAMLIDGRTDSQLSFETPLLAGYANGACTVSNCQVFGTGTGGGLSYIAPLPDKWLDPAQNGETGFGAWLFSGSNAVAGVGLDDGSDAAADLVMILPYIKKSLCLQINTMLNIDNPGGDAPKVAHPVDLTDKFTGSYHAAEKLAGDAALTGQRSGCFQGAGTPPGGTYHFYQVLLTR